MTNRSKRPQHRESISFNGRIEESTDGTLRAVHPTKVDSKAIAAVVGCSVFAATIWTILVLVPREDVHLPAALNNPWGYALICSLPVIPCLVLLGYAVKVRNRRLRQGPVCVEYDSDGNLRIPHANLTVNREVAAVLELVQDRGFNIQHIAEEAIEGPNGSRSIGYPVELNVLIPETEGYIRHPMLTQIMGGSIVRLAERLADKTGWPLLVRVGDDVPEKLVHPLMQEIRDQSSNSPQEIHDKQIKDIGDQGNRQRQRVLANTIHEIAQNLTQTGNGVRLIQSSLFILFFGVVGIILIYLGTRDYQKAIASESWPSVFGMIHESRLVETTRDEDGPQFYAEVEYSYSVDDEHYEGNRIQIASTLSDDRSEVENLLLRFRVNEPARVYYNPDDPAESVLITGGTENQLAAAIFGSVLLVGTLIGVSFWVRSAVRIWKHGADNSTTPTPEPNP